MIEREQGRFVATPAKVRFDRHWTPEPNSGCWLWLGFINATTGYGTFRLDPKELGKSAHRASWILHRGAIPGGLQVCHKCDVRCCVNPDHLFLGTATENMQDAAQKGRMNWKGRPRPNLPRRANHPMAKLTEADVLAIRSETASGRELAERFGIRRETVSRIRRGHTWRA